MQESCAIYAEKGGVGKSTTTVGLAGALAKRGRKGLVWDLDPRATTTTWLDVEPKEAACPSAPFSPRPIRPDGSRTSWSTFRGVTR